MTLALLALLVIPAQAYAAPKAFDFGTRSERSNAAANANANRQPCSARDGGRQSGRDNACANRNSQPRGQSGGPHPGPRAFGLQFNNGGY